MSPRFLTTEALVIGTMRYGEADRIVSLYTRERGRLSAIAKGVRRTKSKVGGRLEPFSLVRLTLVPGKSLYTVVGVDTVRTFQGAREELFRLEHGARLFGVVRHLFPAEELSVPVFNLLVRAVSRLSDAANEETAHALVLATRVKLLALLGYAPSVSECAVCGDSEPANWFSPSLGGVVCGRCAESRAVSCFALSSGAVTTLEALIEYSLADVETMQFDERAVAEVEQVLRQTLAYHGH